MIFRRRPDTTATGTPTTPADGPQDDFEAAWPFNTDSPVIADVVRPDRFLSVLLVDMTGIDWPGIDAQLPTVREIAQQKAMVPVLVVDLLEFQGLINATIAYDTLPNCAANADAAPSLDWASYLVRRRQLLREKWRPAAIINLGTGPDWEPA